jgi:hypothetical protein
MTAAPAFVDCQEPRRQWTSYSRASGDYLTMSTTVMGPNGSQCNRPSTRWRPRWVFDCGESMTELPCLTRIWVSIEWALIIPTSALPATGLIHAADGEPPASCLLHGAEVYLHDVDNTETRGAAANSKTRNTDATLILHDKRHGAQTVIDSSLGHLFNVQTMPLCFAFHCNEFLLYLSPPGPPSARPGLVRALPGLSMVHWIQAFLLHTTAPLALAGGSWSR